MNGKNDDLRAPLTFLIGILFLECVFVVLAGAGVFWGAAFLFFLVSTIQVVTLILIWYVFKLVSRVNDRINNLEMNQSKQECRATCFTPSPESPLSDVERCSRDN